MCVMQGIIFMFCVYIYICKMYICICSRVYMVKKLDFLQGS